MKKIFLLLITLAFVSIVGFSIAGGSMHSRQSSPDMQAIQIHYSADIYSIDQGGIVTMEDSFEVYYQGEKEIFRFGNYFESTMTFLNREGEVLRDSLMDSGLKYSYFVHNRGDTIGLRFDSLQQLKGTKTSVRKFLSRKLSYRTEMFDIDDLTLQRKTMIQNGVYFEVYTPTIKIDGSYADSTYYHYNSDYGNLKYSFSPGVDSMKNSKLFKVLKIYNPYHDTEFDRAIPRREYLFEMKPIRKASYDDVLLALGKSDL